MTPQEKQQELKTILEQQHREWSHHPVTIMLVKTLENHMNDFLVSSISNSMTDAEIRFLAAQIKQTKLIKDFVTNTEMFVKKQLNKETK